MGTARRLWAIWIRQIVENTIHVTIRSHNLARQGEYQAFSRIAPAPLVPYLQSACC